MPLLNKLKPTSKAMTARDAVLWKGPCGEGPLGGVTFSMLNAFLQDRERFRIRYVLGLKPPDSFSHHLEYGHMWHACEEALAAHKPWQPALDEYASSLLKKYPLAHDQVQKWYRACSVQFPVYVQYWAKHKDVEARTPLGQEQVFDVAYTLPTGRRVRLRGKFDSVDLIGKGKTAGVYLQENKTKGEVDPDALRVQLKFDLQTMMYLVALNEYRRINSYHAEVGGAADTKGVRYNVVRRPLSGGKGMIVQKEATQGSKCPKCKGEGWAVIKKPPSKVPCTKCGKSGRINAKRAETADEYWKRVQEYFIKEPQHWFMRWRAEISPSEVAHFETTCLRPLLEQVCSWYDWVTTGDPFAYREGHANNGIHWRHPYGATNMLNEGFGSGVENYLDTGIEQGLVRRKTLFEELQ